MDQVTTGYVLLGLVRLGYIRLYQVISG